jgi:alanine racemase
VFRNVIKPIQATTGFRFKYIHASNSAAMLAYPEAHFDMVRTGIALYGLDPSNERTLPPEFAPVMSWKTIVAQVKTLPPGHPVGYGNTYITSSEERIAILPVGYGDGFRRAPYNWGEVLVRGMRAPILGRISMEKTAINVSHIEDVSIGDEVVLIGQQGDQTLRMEQIASRLGTINYEIATNVLARIPR